MLQTVKKTFKPEFLNRLSGTVVFNEMDRAIHQYLTPLLMDAILFGNLKKGGSAMVTVNDTGEALKLE